MRKTRSIDLDTTSKFIWWNLICPIHPWRMILWFILADLIVYIASSLKGRKIQHG